MLNSSTLSHTIRSAGLIRRSQVAGRRSRVAGRGSRVAGRRSQVTGRRSQVAGRSVLEQNTFLQYSNKQVLFKFSTASESLMV